MKALTYDIPASLLPNFRERKMIVRSHDPAEIVKNVTNKDLSGISFVKLLSLDGDIDSLIAWGHAIPVDLVVSDTYRDLPLLYRYAPLLAGHPIRVSVPLVPGFGNVVKLAISLNFTVKLEGGQPDESLLDEIQQIAHLYLHQSMVSEPIEFFHSLFLAFYHRDPITLWAIQEEDPSFVRHITEKGEEKMPGRLAGAEINEDFSTFMQKMQKGPAVEKSECAECKFLTHCQGYFKWPRKEYHCDGMKALMHTLWSAAEELRADVALFHSSRESERT